MLLVNEVRGVRGVGQSAGGGAPIWKYIIGITWREEVILGLARKGGSVRVPVRKLNCVLSCGRGFGEIREHLEAVRGARAWEDQIRRSAGGVGPKCGAAPKGRVAHCQALVVEGTEAEGLAGMLDPGEGPARLRGYKDWGRLDLRSSLVFHRLEVSCACLARCCWWLPCLAHPQLKLFLKLVPSTCSAQLATAVSLALSGLCYSIAQLHGKGCPPPPRGWVYSDLPSPPRSALAIHSQP